MTCIVGLKYKNKVYIGADSAGSGTHATDPRKDLKIFKHSDMLFGFTTSFRMGQLLQYHLSLQKAKPEVDPMKYLVTKFIPAARQCLTAGGFAKKDNNVETGGQFIVGFRGRLFVVWSDFQVAETLRPYVAVGCGLEWAEGVLFTLKKSKISPEEKVKIALEAAVEHSGWVRPPFTILSV